LLATLVDKLPRRSQKVVALDWDAQTLKAVEAVAGKAGLKIQRVISAHIPGDVKLAEPDSFGAFIRRVLHDKKFSAHQVLLAVPRDKAILINHRLPQAPVGDLSSMVKLQASRELPFSADEAVIDFAGSQAHDAPEFLDVTIGAIQREAMTFYQQLAHHAGLHLLRLGLRPNSNLVSVTRGQHPFSDDRILFVDIGAQATEISIFRWGRLTFSRAVGITIDTKAGSDTAGRNVLMEVLRTVEAYRASDPNKLDQVIVAGDSGLEGWLAEALRGRFNAPASIYDPTWTVAIEKDRAEQMTGFCAVLGLLVGQTIPELGRFDFVTPKRPPDMAAIRRRQSIMAATAVVALLAIIWITRSTVLSQLKTEDAQLTAQLSALDKQFKESQKIIQRVEAAQKWAKQEVVWIDSLKRLAEQMPSNEQIYATKLQAKAQRREFDMGLRAKGLLVPNDLQTRLIDSGVFSAEIGPIGQGPDPKGYKYRGDMSIQIVEKNDKPGFAKDKTPGKPATAQSQPVRPVVQVVERP